MIHIQNTLRHLVQISNIVFLNGKTIKDRSHSPTHQSSEPLDFSDYIIMEFNRTNGTLVLVTSDMFKTIEDNR